MRYVYIIKCADESLYAGITTDLDRRIYEHNFSIKWAKYTKVRRPILLVRSIVCDNRSEATKEELKIKKMNKMQKIELINSQNNLAK